jgi:hypothetical protein
MTILWDVALFGSVKRDQHQDVGEWIILKWMLERCDDVVWTGSICVRFEDRSG